MLKAPCKGCEERQVGCHSKCTKYKQFKQEVDKMRKYEEEKQKQLVYSLYTQKKSSIWYNKRK